MKPLTQVQIRLMQNIARYHQRHQRLPRYVWLENQLNLSFHSIKNNLNQLRVAAGVKRTSQLLLWWLSFEKEVR